MSELNLEQLIQFVNFSKSLQKNLLQAIQNRIFPAGLKCEIEFQEIKVNEKNVCNFLFVVKISDEIKQSVKHQNILMKINQSYSNDKKNHLTLYGSYYASNVIAKFHPTEQDLEIKIITALTKYLLN